MLCHPKFPFASQSTDLVAENVKWMTLEVRAGGDVSHFHFWGVIAPLYIYTGWQTLWQFRNRTFKRFATCWVTRKLLHHLLCFFFSSPFFHILSSVSCSLSHLFSFTHIAIIFFFLVIIDIIYRLDSHFFFTQNDLQPLLLLFFFWYIGVRGFSHSQRTDVYRFQDGLRFTPLRHMGIYFVVSGCFN